MIEGVIVYEFKKGIAMLVEWFNEQGKTIDVGYVSLHAHTSGTKKIKIQEIQK